MALAVTLVVWRVERDLEQQVVNETFASRIQLIEARIASRMLAYEQVLRGGVAVFSTFQTVTRDNWRSYVAVLDLDRDYPGIQGVGYAQRIRPEERAAHVAAVRAEGFPDYDIRPEGDREELTSIVYLEPFDARNQAAFGYDMFSNDIRRTAMERARDTGLASVSGRVELVQEITTVRQAGFLLYLPVYARESDPQTVEERRAALAGYVYSPFRATDLMQGILQREFPEIALEVFDGTTADAAELLYSGVDADAPPPDLTEITTIEVAGRPWTVVFSSTPAFVAETQSALSKVLLLGGLTVTILVFGTVWTLASARGRAVRLAEAMARTRESIEAKFRDLFAYAPDAVVMVGTDGTIQDANRQAEATFGYAQDEIVGQPVEILVPETLGRDHVGLRDAYLATPQRRTMAAGNLDLRGRRKDGSTFRADISLTPLASGRETVIAATVRDLTDRIAMEKQLNQAQKMEAIGQLTGGIAHDFNNLLSVIVGNLDLVEPQVQSDPRAAKRLQAALDSALRGAELTRRLLAFARQQPLEPQAIDLNRRLPELEAILTRMLGETIQMSVAPGRQLWWCVADPSQVDNALLNLAINARDAMPNGGNLVIETANITIDESAIAKELEVSPGDYVMLAVTDTGTGMSPEVLERATEPFFTTKEVGRGSGLGLSMVFGFAQQSGGYLKIYSELGHGTSVKIYLPRTAAPEGEATAAATETAAAVGGGERVLLVEDNPDLREAVGAQLIDLGYRVEAVGHAQAALDHLERDNAFDLLFTDIVMPGGKSGYDLAREARRRYPDLKVLLTSGYAATAAGNGLESEFGASVLSKPYRMDDLAQRIRAVLSGE
ncbi:MAG: CHASE domain-containing protein [Rhodospirillaceae bacterium]|nr:CHASE domain-containing protein [Rhodospirillaceae bacterium]